MDLRIERTKRNIINAFIALRANKPIEKITIKELAEFAVINKATFYLHYKDIYDLSDQLENEILENALSAIPVDDFIRLGGVVQLAEIFTAQSELFNTLFSGSRVDVMAHKLDNMIKQRVFTKYPKWRKNITINVKLTAIIYGSIHAYFQYQKEDFDTVISELNTLCFNILP